MQPPMQSRTTKATNWQLTGNHLDTLTATQTLRRGHRVLERFTWLLYQIYLMTSARDFLQSNVNTWVHECLKYPYTPIDVSEECFEAALNLLLVLFILDLPMPNGMLHVLNFIPQSAFYVALNSHLQAHRDWHRNFMTTFTDGSKPTEFSPLVVLSNSFQVENHMGRVKGLLEQSIGSARVDSAASLARALQLSPPVTAATFFHVLRQNVARAYYFARRGMFVSNYETQITWYSFCESLCGKIEHRVWQMQYTRRIAITAHNQRVANLPRTHHFSTTMLCMGLVLCYLVLSLHLSDVHWVHCKFSFHALVSNKPICTRLVANSTV